MADEVDIKQVAAKLKWSLPTVRRWMWHLGVQPSGTATRSFTTSRGLRRTRILLYDPKVVEQLKKAHDKEVGS